MAKEELFASETLRVARRERGLSQQEMADILTLKLGRNVAFNTYQKWEYSLRPVSTEAAVIISRELGRSIKDLFVKGEYNFTQ